MRKKTDKYLDLFLYQVETDENGKKSIHIDGYCYWNDESYQLVQGTFCYISVGENDSYNFNAELAFEGTKQYQREVTEQEMIDYYKGTTELSMASVREDTPDGIYVDY